MLDFLTLFVNNFHPIIIVNADWIITAETVQRQRIVLLREGIRAEPAGGARVVESCSEVVVGDCGVEEGLVFLAGEPPPVARVGQGLGGRASCEVPALSEREEVVGLEYVRQPLSAHFRGGPSGNAAPGRFRRLLILRHPASLSHLLSSVRSRASEFRQLPLNISMSPGTGLRTRRLFGHRALYRPKEKHIQPKLYRLKRFFQ